MTLLLKKDFIYVNHNSITNELCDDILDIFERNIINKEILKEYNKNIKNNYYEQIDIDYGKIKTHLNNDIINNIKNYITKINSVNNFLNYFVYEDIDFFIKKLNNCKIDENEYNFIKKIGLNKNGYKIFKFIWFLNDFDGEIIFWNDYIIKPKKGTLVIFPISWCFPYEKKINKDFEINIIYGYLHKK